MTPYYQDASVTLLHADVLAGLAALPDESVQCCVTSPPYWGLRDYGTATWEGGDADCVHRGRDERTVSGGNGKQYTNAGSNRVYSGDCACGAVRVDDQIGLEKTPDEYVAKMVAVFREVRRVLANDGTLWLNLGDSYAADRGGTHMPAETLAGGVSGIGDEDANRGRNGKVARRDCTRYGLKHKDLVGIPWRVAFALQQPYYTGRIRDERDRIWLAAMLDAEGCLFIHKRKTGQNNGQGYERKNDSYGPGLEISNTHESIVRRCMAIAGVGSICTQDEGRRQKLFRWNVRTTESRDLVRELYPYLVAKQHQARVLCGCPSSGEKAEAAHAALILLHRGSLTTVDFPAPASMYEPGYYLRSDIIWSKSNPMPESVTDRPTKAHEYLFLLSKSERYHYDANAIAENANPDYAARYDYALGGAKNVHLLDSNQQRTRPIGMREYSGKRNRRTVWTVATTRYAGAHFATFPPDLIIPCILAGCPEGGTVLDPFGGSGTTGAVAKGHGRKAVLIELNAEYCALAVQRWPQQVMDFGGVG